MQIFSTHGLRHSMVGMSVGHAVTLLKDVDSQKTGKRQPSLPLRKLHADHCLNSARIWSTVYASQKWPLQDLNSKLDP